MVDMVVILENLRTNLKRCWNNFRRLVQLYVNDCDRCLELLKVGGGMAPVPGTEPWKRYLLTLYRLLGFYQFVMSVTRAGFLIQNQDNLIGLFASLVLVATMTAICIKNCIMKHYEEAIQNSKAFLRSNTGHSSDPDHDAMIRQDTARTSGKVILTMFIVLSCDQVMMWVPNSSQDIIFGIPEKFQVLGSMAFCLLQGAYISTCIYFWACQYYYTTLMSMHTFRELSSELMIVARGFETIEDQVQAQVLDDQSIGPGTSRKQPCSNALKWKHLKRILGAIVEQHVEVLRAMQLMQPVVSWLYTIIHYCTMFGVSMIVLLVIRCEVSLISIVLAVASCTVILECYIWCQLTDSCQETMEKIADAVAQLSFRLEHSVDNHSEYIQMRTSLMIIQLNASQANWFNCGVFFPISVESFGDLCMIIYRFATFLMDLD